jgi:tRNA pseudouridine65 synthase
VAVHKPSGLVTYSDTPGVAGAKEVLEKQLGRRLFPVHRIDKDTCGVLVFALSEAASRSLTELFRSRVVKKQYLAVVHGLAPARGVIDTPL